MVLKKDTYPNQVADFIKSLIQSNELKQGEAVKEALIAERLGISRAPIREALQQLVYEGLMTSLPQKGKYVIELSAKEIVDSYSIGGILEGAGIANSLELWTDFDIKDLSIKLDELKSASQKAKGLDELMDLDYQFHAILLKHCDNAKLIDMSRLSCANISRYLCHTHWLALYTPQSFYERHKVIAEAVLKKDKELVEKLVRVHYREIGEKISIFYK